MHSNVGVGSARCRSRRAFTLIELLVVVSIIALLVSILLPSLSAAREQAKTLVCASNLKNVGTAMVQYTAKDKRGSYPASYVYPFDEYGNWSPMAQDLTHTFGYLHWSNALYNAGEIGDKAFQCPKFTNGGAPRTNPGRSQEDWEDNQVDQNGSSAPNDLKDWQAPRMCYAGNAAIIPRNKFTEQMSGGQRTNRFVMDTEVTRAQGTILATEYVNNWRALGIPQGGGSDGAVLSKSHRPINVFWNMGSGYNEYQATMFASGFLYGETPEAYPESYQDYGLLDVQSAERMTNILDHTGSKNQANAVGRHHPGGGQDRRKYGGTANFLFCDGHVERMTVYESLHKRLWGDRYYSLNGPNQVQNYNVRPH